MILIATLLAGGFFAFFLPCPKGAREILGRWIDHGIRWCIQKCNRTLDLASSQSDVDERHYIYLSLIYGIGLFGLFPLQTIPPRGHGFWPIIVSIYVYLATLMRLTFPWRCIDRGIKWCTRFVAVDIDSRAWTAGAPKRYRIYRLVSVGTAIILLLPFGLLQKLGSNPIEILQKLMESALIQDLQKLLMRSNTPHTVESFELWELSVVLWSCLYLGSFYITSMYEATSNPVVQSGDAFKIGLWGAIASVVVALFSAGTIILGMPPPVRLSGELGFVILLLGTDIYFLRYFRRRRKPESAREYAVFLFAADLPTFFAMAALMAYLLLCSPSEQNGQGNLPFVAGAAALNLVLVNLVFSALYIWQSYLSNLNTDKPATTSAA